jgi:hypothetical protein
MLPFINTKYPNSPLANSTKGTFNFSSPNSALGTSTKGNFNFGASPAANAHPDSTKLFIDRLNFLKMKVDDYAPEKTLAK